MYLFEGVEGKQNLRVIYDDSNKKYFGNALPKIKVRWDGRLKRAIGKASVKYFGDKFEPRIDPNSLSISMSKAYDLNYEDTVAVMLHEMTHIQLYTENNLGNHHTSSYFQSIIRRLRKESGLNVVFKESSFKTSPNAPAMDGYIAIIHAGGGLGLTVYSTPFIKKNWRQLGEFLDRFIPSGKIRKMELWRVKHQVIKNSTKKRSLKRISWNNISTEEIESIKKSGFQWAEFSSGKTYIDGKKAGL